MIKDTKITHEEFLELIGKSRQAVYVYRKTGLPYYTEGCEIFFMKNEALNWYNTNIVKSFNKGE